MKLNDLLRLESIDPTDVLALRLTPKEPEFRKNLPRLVEERPDLFTTYLRAQRRQAERMMPNVSYIASFLGRREGNKALFVGLYKKGDAKQLSRDQYWEIPGNKELKTFGMEGFTKDRNSKLWEDRSLIRWFDLERTEFYVKWIGRLIVCWPEGQSQARRAHNANIPVDAILEESDLSGLMPPWDELVLAWERLGVLPRSWRDELSRWRGIYLILDTSDGKSYVGSASGVDNILGRWMDYKHLGHGGNKELKKRDPKNFRFSVLELTAPQISESKIYDVERKWKKRLHTIEFGMNEN